MGMERVENEAAAIHYWLPTSAFQIVGDGSLFVGTASSTSGPSEEDLIKPVTREELLAPKNGQMPVQNQKYLLEVLMQIP